MENNIKESIAVKESLLKDQVSLKSLENITEAIKVIYQKEGKILIAGNGGSASDAQHFAAEITCQYKATRRGYPAIALHTDTSALTAWGNDKSFETFFGRQVEALGQKGDALIVISTSGNSADLIYAVEQAKKGGLKAFALLGCDGGKLHAQGLCDEVIIVPSQNTPRIQECHIMLIHIICEALDTFLVELDQNQK